MPLDQPLKLCGRVFIEDVGDNVRYDFQLTSWTT